VYTLRRDRLPDGAETTVYVVRHPLRGLRPRVQLFRQARRLDHWCQRKQVREAIVGGFYLRDPFRPLGEVRIDGEAVAHEPFPDPHRALRPALRVSDGDLLQAGPLLVSDGEVVFDRGADLEGFSAASEQFDSDITDGRHPRAAIGIGDGHVTVVVCDGRRSRIDDGLSLAEIGAVMRDLGCHVAMNLDGGGSTTLVHRGHLLNRPYSNQDQPAPQTRRVVTALALEPAA
jgi:hypothetical protein